MDGAHYKIWKGSDTVPGMMSPVWFEFWIKVWQTIGRHRHCQCVYFEVRQCKEWEWVMSLSTSLCGCWWSSLLKAVAMDGYENDSDGYNNDKSGHMNHYGVQYAKCTL